MIKPASQALMVNMLAVLFSITLCFALFSNSVCAVESNKAAGKSAKFKQSYIWYDGDREHKVWMNPQLVAEFNPEPLGEKAVKNAYPSAKILPARNKSSGIRLWQLGDTTGITPDNIKARHPQGRYSVILHDGPSNGSRMRALPGNIIVYLDPKWSEKEINNWLNKHKFEVVKKLDIGMNAYVIKTAPGIEALDIANALYRAGEVKAAFPDWWQEVKTR